MGKKRRKQRNAQSKIQPNHAIARKKKVENGNENKKFESDSCDIQEISASNINYSEKSKQMNRITKKSEIFDIPVGLSNLGNTCFFNSIMQNILQTRLLHTLLKNELSASNEKSIVVSSDDGQIPPLTYTTVGSGELSTTLSEFIDSVKSLQQSNTEVISNRKAMRSKVYSPRSLFSQICSKNERFRGYQQQDSQELYHCLLDAIKTEEIKRKKRGILKALNLTKAVHEEIPQDVLQRVKAYGRVVSEEEDTIVEKVFGGSLVSSVLCDSCHTVTGVIEPFHDISLPIIEEKIPKPNANEKSNKADESDQDSIPDNSHDNKKPMSKHAMKKARKAADKEAKRSRRKLKKELAASVEKAEPVEKLADSLAELTLSLAMRTLFEIKDHTELQQHDKTTDTPKLKGGAVSGRNLNLPKEELSNNESESKIKLDMAESEKSSSKSEETKDIASLKSDEDWTKSDDFDMEDLETGLKNLSLYDTEVNGSYEVEPEESDTICGNLFEEEDESRSATPVSSITPLSMQESSLFDTPKRHEPIYTSVQSSNSLPQTLSPRTFAFNSKVCSLESCFYHFTMPEILTGSNKFGCEICTKRQNASGDAKERKTVYCNASKQILIKTPPAVLTIHLKRFQQVRCSLRKVNKHVTIPTILDISPYCSQECEKFADEDMKIAYGVYGMVEHSGSLSRGHYTAYVRSRIEEDPDPDSGQWYHISDTQVTKVSATKALKCNAYLIFYERLNHSPMR